MQLKMTNYRRTADLMEAQLDDELVALDPIAGKCLGFNSVAAFVWRQLEVPKNFNELQEALLREYEVEPRQCASELKHLLDDLCARRLVTASHSGEAGRSSDIGPSQDFTA